MSIKAIGYHVVVEKYDHQETEGKLITQAIPKYKIVSIGKDAFEAFSEQSLIGTNVYLRPGSEGEPLRKNGKYFYFVHIDYILGYD